MNKQRIKYLFNGFLHKKLTQDEEEELLQIIETTPEAEFEEIVTELIDMDSSEQISFQEWNSRISSAISFDKPKQKISRLKNIYRYTAAAAILMLAGLSVFFYVHHKPEKEALASSGNIKPGESKAVLITANGKEIVLNSALDTTKLVALNPGIKSVSADGLIYKQSDEASGKAVGVNVLKTPKGGQYHIVLPDGTTVWLNSASELKFPSTFSSASRDVELKGEAYFEVAKYAGKGWTFNVKSDRQVVQVLGTKFNISAYENETFVKTSLAEGKVRVTGSGLGKSFTLKPGQESALNTKSSEIKVYDAEIADAIAWKEGLFVFDNENLFSAMNKISRWYDVEIVYQGEVKDKALWGTISRTEKIESLLKTLASTGVAKFKIEGRRVFVML